MVTCEYANGVSGTEGDLSPRSPGTLMNRSELTSKDVLTRAEINALTSACSRRAPTGLRNRALINLLYRTGLRVSEALALTPAHIDMDTGRGVVPTPGGGERSFVVVNGTLAMLEQWWEARERLAVERGWNPRTAPLFCTLTGTELSARYVQAMLQRLADKAGVDKHVHPQALRDAYAADLLRDGAGAQEIQAALGHQNSRSTDRYLQRFERGGEILHLRDHRDRFPVRAPRPQDATSDDITRVLVDLLLERGISAERLLDLLSRAS